MDGAAELRQLAHLMRVAASTTREIAVLRFGDADAILSLADRVDTMAVDLDRIASTRVGDRFGRRAGMV